MRGMISFLMIEVGTVQVGLRLIDLDMGGDFRRGMLGVADDGDIAMDDLAVLDRLDRGRGQIDHDIAIVEGEIGPGEAVGAGGELLEPHARRNVHRLQRRAGDDAGLASAPCAPGSA